MYRILLLVFLPALVIGQPSTEVYLFDINNEGATITLSNPTNISNNAGKYDNQPYFDKNGEHLYYVKSIGKNSDIVKYNVSQKTEERITDTPAGEYSPQVTPDGKFISSIILNDAGYQRLVKYPLEGGERQVVVPEKIIGYYVWWDNATLVSFVLGEPATLEITNLLPMEHTVVTENIGRSIHMIPNTGLVSFTQDGQIKSLNPKSKEILTVTNMVEGGEDMAWLPDGSIFMSSGNKLFHWTKANDWNEIADMTSFGLGDLTRIAISPRVDKLALVVEVQSLFSRPNIQMGLIARDLEKTLAFYQDIIGMTRIGGFDIDEAFGRASGLSNGVPFSVIQLKLEDSPAANELKVVSFGNTYTSKKSAYIQDELGLQYLTIYVKNIQPFIERLESNNIPFLGETPISLPDGRYFVLIQDPDGTFVELIGPKAN